MEAVGGRGLAGRQGGDLGRVAHDLAPVGGVGRALVRGAIGGVFVPHLGDGVEDRAGRRAAARGVVELGCAVGQQGHAEAVGGQVVNAQAPQEALRSHAEQDVGSQRVARRVQRRLMVAAHGGHGLGDRIGGGGHVDDLKQGPMGRVEGLEHLAASLDETQRKRLGLSRGLIDGGAEGLDVQIAPDVEIVGRVEDRIGRVQPLGEPQAGLGFRQRVFQHRRHASVVHDTGVRRRDRRRAGAPEPRSTSPQAWCVQPVR